ncbi:DNA sulfur modification protein DndB [Streptomyces sp. NPDC033754]|uniref:DNA sulfur modification protein DndB n=1 Tax=unclassified Streptomyces TaxID=2593676 RepID=UPI0033C16586
MGSEFAGEIDRGAGDPVRVLELSPTRLLTTMPWGQLARIVPDPRRAEDTKGLRYLSSDERKQAELRNEVQRSIKAAKKWENAKAYAHYIAAVISGEREENWATPPFALWIEEPLRAVRLNTVFGADKVAYLPFGTKGVLVDAETQHLAHYILLDAPEEYGVTADQVNRRLVGVEIYHDLGLVDARQIFHDRNLLGVIPNKNVALASDSVNVATNITLALLKNSVPLPASGDEVPLESLVSLRQRQLKAVDREWMTLSTLRAFVITAIFGRSGFDKTSGAIAELPEGCTNEVAETAISDVLNLLFTRFGDAFQDRLRTVIAAPAVFAALGAVAHRSMPWAAEPRRSLDQLGELLSDVNWARDARYWGGIIGKETARGTFSLAGGVKDSGSRTATALEDPESDRYLWIRRGQSGLAN